MRGSGELPYNPGRPLTLPGDRHKRRRPQLRTDLLASLILPLLALGGVGVGVFFGVSALLDNDTAPTTAAAPTDAAPPAAAPTDAAPTDAVPTDVATADAAGDNAAPIDADQPATAGAPVTDDAADAGAATDGSAGVVTDAQLSGAPALLERGGATPVPSGIVGLTLADGSIYDPADETAALSSVWPAGTVLELTRLPGGPLLSDQDAAELIGKVVQVLVVGNGDFPTELQLSPAAFQLLARDFEPIIALRIVAVAVAAPAND